MNIDQAKAIPIAEILEKMGYKPSRKANFEYWYLSPLRQEKTASFQANIKKNIWFDFGLGEGGDAIDLISKYLKAQGVQNTVSDALRWLDNMFDHAPKIMSITELPTETKNDPSALSITSIKNIHHRVLENYLSDRGIPLQVAVRYLKEVRIHNKASGKNFVALGFKNEEGGYEIRNQKFKGCVKPKYISFIRGANPDCKQVHVFEGVFDFLTAVTLNNGKHFEGDTIVLNSLALLSKVTPYIKGYGYSILYSWMDNDEVGKNATASLEAFAQTEEGLRHVPMNSQYEPYKDVNAAHTAKLGLSME